MRPPFAALAIVVIALFAIFAADRASAHQQKAAITDVLFNERTGYLEVAHRFILHDAEHALQEMTGRQVDLMTDTEAMDAFVEYAASRFELRDLQGASIDLALVGYERDRGFLWVYQEAQLPEDPVGLTIRHEALRDVWLDQTNTVNITFEDRVYTLSFAGADDLLAVTF